MKIIKNICSGPIFYDKWVGIGFFPYIKVIFSHFFMNKKIFYTLNFFLISIVYRYSLAEFTEIIENICSGPIFLR